MIFHKVGLFFISLLRFVVFFLLTLASVKLKKYKFFFFDFINSYHSINCCNLIWIIITIDSLMLIVLICFDTDVVIFINLIYAGFEN